MGSKSTPVVPGEKNVVPNPTKGRGTAGTRLPMQKLGRDGDQLILSPVDAIYQKFVSIFGNTNESQVFSLIWPGTILDPHSYDGLDDNGVDGILASIAQSLLFDQHYPVGTITQPDGTRVSDRYAQAIQRYGIVPNASLLSLQSILRDRLSQVTQMSIDGKLVSMTLLDQFNYLNGIWTSRRQQWDDQQTTKIQQLKASGDANWFAEYVEWYGINAQPYIDSINAAYDRLIAEFPLNAFQDALSILGTQEAAALLRARNDLANATIPVPSSIGNDYVVTQAIPADWGSILTSSMTFVDLLASPQAQQAALDTAITVLQQQIYGWQAILAQIPAGQAADIAAALAAFEDAGNTYSAAVDSTLSTYTNNAVTAVQIYMNNKQDETTLGQINQAKQDMDIAAGNEPADLNQEQVDAIIGDIGKGQSDLITSNSSMVSAGYNLASKATAYLNSKNGAGLKSMIQPVVDQLTSQLALVVQKAADLASSAARAQQLAAGANPAFKDGPVLDPVMPSNAASAINQRWSEITLSVNASSMATSSTATTSYEQMNWSVDLFFGSAGGESSEASSSFASNYMKQDSTIQIGMLATKVVIQRPWMHPELFNMSSNYFRVSQDPLTTPTPPEGGWTRDLIVPQELGGSAPGTSGGMAARALNQGPFPAYPVALLLVKDVTIKFSYDSAKTNAFEQQSSSNSTQGGGFFCFSVSEQQSSSSDTKSSGSYSQAGTYAFKIAAPQVIGAWLQITPPDNSVPLDETLASEIADSLGFVTKLQAVAQAGRATFKQPSQRHAN
ncbi:hypothetical protein [Sphingorhabdus sp.]|uniref:hypothetical protein n=1 Tax=Sphingorhabdus sp. TaxID=1902408 RepID=UPI0039192722